MTFIATPIIGDNLLPVDTVQPPVVDILFPCERLRSTEPVHRSWFTMRDVEEISQRTAENTYPSWREYFHNYHRKLARVYCLCYIIQTVLKYILKMCISESRKIFVAIPMY